MKKLFLPFVFFFFISLRAAAQQTLLSKEEVPIAQAELSEYKAIYQLNSGDSSIIKSTLRNIQNALSDPRLKGKLKVELVVHGAGVAVFMKDQPFEEALVQLQKQGVFLVQCLNTLKEKHISKDQLFPFISYTPSGNGELIIRQQQGWVYIHP